MGKKIRVAILDDHQSVIDGYAFRLSTNKNIQIVGTANYGSKLEKLVSSGNVDVLLLDISLPVSEDNQNPYPVLNTLPHLRKQFPHMAVMVISMHAERPLVRAVMEAGANGYLLKDDHDAIVQLAEAVTLVSTGGIFLSKQLRNLYSQPEPMDAAQNLSKRQLEALSICAAFRKLIPEELAQKMAVAPSTVRNLLSHAYRRLHVHNRTAAITRARQLGLITPYSPQP